MFDAAMLDAPRRDRALETVALEAVTLDPATLELATVEPEAIEPATVEAAMLEPAMLEAAIEAMTIKRSASRDKNSVVENDPSTAPIAAPGRPSPAETGEEADAEPCSEVDPRAVKEDSRNGDPSGYARSGGPYTSHGSYAARRRRQGLPVE